MSKDKKYILCIAGSRDLTDYSLIQKGMQMHNIQLDDIKEIISGGAKGVDSNAQKFAEFHKIKFKEYPADWKNLKHKDAIITDGPYGKYDKRAGFRRNTILAEKADKLLAITNGSSGTDHIINCMKELNKEVFVYEVDPPEKTEGVEGKDYFTF
jgi:predicted Rossmann fold nucleotide-binding protein DprA/Smf involved in DNA uptake